MWYRRVLALLLVMTTAFAVVISSHASEPVPTYAPNEYSFFSDEILDYLYSGMNNFSGTSVTSQVFLTPFSGSVHQISLKYQTSPATHRILFYYTGGGYQMEQIRSVTYTLPDVINIDDNVYNLFNSALSSGSYWYSIHLDLVIRSNNVDNSGTIFRLTYTAADGSVFVSYPFTLNGSDGGSNNVATQISIDLNKVASAPSITQPSLTLTYDGNMIHMLNSSYIGVYILASSYISRESRIIDDNTAEIVDAIDAAVSNLGGKLDEVNSSIQAVQDYLDSFKEPTEDFPAMAPPTLSVVDRNLLQSAQSQYGTGLQAMQQAAEVAVSAVIDGIDFLFVSGPEWLKYGTVSLFFVTVGVFVYNLLKRRE